MTTVCPVCHRHIRQHPDRPVMAPHTDTIHKTCPMSGQPIGTEMSHPTDTVTP